MRAAMALIVLLGSCSQTELTPAAQHCEQYLLGKLKAPSSYKRVSVSETPIPYDKPKSYSVIIEYDAVNSYNAPMRDRQFCSFPVKDGRPITNSYIDFDSALAGDSDEMMEAMDNRLSFE